MSEIPQALFERPELAGAKNIEKAVAALSDGDFFRARRIGSSVCGRPIVALEAGAMRAPVVIVGGTHAMEWASVLVTLKLAAEVAELVAAGHGAHGINLRESLSCRGAVFVPLLNPDGFEIRRTGRGAAPQRARRLARFADSDLRYWQANANGVDINHNFNAGFYRAMGMVAELGIRSPAPTRYGGLFPFSQPESRAVRRLCEVVRPRALYALHSQGEEIYWRYGTALPEGSAYIAKLLASLSGYALCEPDVVASHAGLKDWFIKKYNRPGFTIELGQGKNPLPYEDFAAIWDRVERMMYVSLIV